LGDTLILRDPEFGTTKYTRFKNWLRPTGIFKTKATLHCLNRLSLLSHGTDVKCQKLECLGFRNI
jgi:hypothetical protein